MRLLACGLLAGAALGLHPQPTRPPPLREEQRAARRYFGRGGIAPTEARVGIFPCNSSGLLQQTFILNATSGAVTLPDGQCLLRTGDDNVQSAGPCAGAGASGEWTLTPCTARGCNPATQSWLVSAVDGKVLGLPGAVGPWTDVWTVDNPTGADFNELWAFNASDSTVRSLCSCPSTPGVLGGCLSVVPPPPPPPPCTDSPRVRCHVGRWDAPPTNTPSVCVSVCEGGVGISSNGQPLCCPPLLQQAGVVDGPLLGNGDLGAAFGGSAGAQGVFFGKADMWATNTVVGQRAPQLHSDTFYTQVAAGSVTLAAPALGGAGASYAATQDLASATVTTSATAPGGAAAGGRLNTTAFIAASSDVLVATLTVEGPAPLALTITLAQARRAAGRVSGAGPPLSFSLARRRTATACRRARASTAWGRPRARRTSARPRAA